MIASSDLIMSSMTHVDTEAAPNPQLLQLKEGLTNKQLLDWLLEEEGIQCTLRTLERRLQQWGVRRNAVTP